MSTFKKLETEEFKEEALRDNMDYERENPDNAELANHANIKKLTISELIKMLASEHLSISMKILIRERLEKRGCYLNDSQT